MRATANPASDQMNGPVDTPDRLEEEAVLRAMHRVRLIMSLIARSDIGPPPKVQPGPAIYAANHRSLADLLLASITFYSWRRPIRPLVAAPYFDKPGLGPLLRRLRCIPVEGAGALALATAELEAGWSIAIMPEGRIVPPGEWAATGVGRAHPGVGRLALDTGLPVVASGASGTERLWPYGAAAPRIRPWRRYPLALRSEVVGVVEARSSRDATAMVMTALTRCVRRADAATGLRT